MLLLEVVDVLVLEVLELVDVLVLDEVLLEPPQGPHLPIVLPMGISQSVPGQQSALVVHAPQALTHAGAQMNGGFIAGFGTQGRALQQSALDMHALPAPTQATSVHRGTPRLSGLQVSWVSQLPAQQSHEALHDIDASLQTSPLGLQLVGLRQTPTVFGAVMTHAPMAPPQQSVSVVHRSPTTWQPLAGWQMSTPVGP